jgi:hypothetical protein
MLYMLDDGDVEAIVWALRSVARDAVSTERFLICSEIADKFQDGSFKKAAQFHLMED